MPLRSPALPARTGLQWILIYKNRSKLRNAESCIEIYEFHFLIVAIVCGSRSAFALEMHLLTISLKNDDKTECCWFSEL